jgi:hypothetical protein
MKSYPLLFLEEIHLVFVSMKPLILPLFALDSMLPFLMSIIH